MVTRRFFLKSSGLALVSFGAVPSALVPYASGERNVLLNPLHPDAAAIREVQRLEVTLDERI